MCVRSVVMFLVLCCAMAIFAGVEGKPGHYTPTWAVHIEGGRQMADMVAAEHGFINLGEIIGDFYHFHHNSVKRRSISPSLHHHGKLHSDDRVRWVRQQRILSRKKRDFLPLVDPTASSAATSPVRNTLLPEVTKLSHPDSSERSDRDLIQSARPGRTPMPVVFDTTKFPLNDHRWPQMWYLNRGGGLDMNVIPAWKEGVTGRGIVVTILDDGLEKDHPDLLVNYDPQASYDVNNHDEDPMPRYDMLDSNRHGTRCAGEVAATANNTLCAVGVAFGASVGGVRMLDGDVTDAVEARSLSLNPQHIDIYSASWGPDDDGKTVDGPGELATRAFIEGVTKGRSGKGSIFIWASGNGGRDHDNCNCDGYTNSIWTLSISSATEKGEVPWYSEMCSSTLATTYSSGSMNEKQVVTTDLHHSCTNSHTGTSASAPLAAGICALALEVNRDLTWRDMQHIVVRTAKPANLQASGWRTNGVGRNVSHSFGYGLMDAAAMVQLARTWRTVPAQHRCEVSAPHNDKLIPAKSQVVLQLAVNQCVGVNYLEHVQAKISLTAARRGDLQINLTSPAGTRVTLLATRSHDMSRAGFNSWPFMTVHTWGESPYGIWLLEIHNEGRYMAEISQWDMVFYGTDVPAQETDFPVKPKIDAIDSAGELSIGEGEAGQHNSLEEEKVVGKWRDSQRVRDDGRVELQPETPVNTAEDASASGCLSFVSSQTPPHCLGLCLIILALFYTLNNSFVNFTREKTMKRKARKGEDSRKRRTSENINSSSHAIVDNQKLQQDNTNNIKVTSIDVENNVSTEIFDVKKHVFFKTVCLFHDIDKIVTKTFIIKFKDYLIISNNADIFVYRILNSKYNLLLNTNNDIIFNYFENSQKKISSKVNDLLFSEEKKKIFLNESRIDFAIIFILLHIKQYPSSSYPFLGNINFSIPNIKSIRQLCNSDENFYVTCSHDAFYTVQKLYI